MEGFLRFTLIFVAACVGVSSFPVNTHFQEFAEGHIRQSNCSFPPRSLFEQMSGANFRYKKCLEEDPNSKFTSLLCSNIMSLSKSVCRVKDVKPPPSSAKIFMSIEDPEGKIPDSNKISEKVTTMCSSVAFLSLATTINGTDCMNECATPESFFICDLYYAMDTQERKSFTDIKDFKALDLYLLGVPRHPFPPAGVIVEPDAPFNSCLNKSADNIILELCSAVLSLAAVASETNAPKIDTMHFIKNTSREAPVSCEKFAVLNMPAHSLEILTMLKNGSKCEAICGGSHKMVCKGLYLGLTTLQGGQPAGEETKPTGTGTDTELTGSDGKPQPTELSLGATCEMGKDGCIENAECVLDSEATKEYKCVCKEGYTKGEDDNTLCKKVEPTTKLSLGATCEMGKDGCIENAECALDSEATKEYKCVCKEGYTKGEDDNTLCKKVEPTTIVEVSLGMKCTLDTDKCVDNAECVLDDTQEYKCACKEGYTKGEDDNTLCKKVEPPTTIVELSLGMKCTLDIDKCVDNAVCVLDSEATKEYKCACKEGYTKGEDDNTLCKKVETPTTKLSLGMKCTLDTDKCIDNAECVVDSEATQEYKCTCKEGYTKGEDDNTLCKKVEPPTTIVEVSLGMKCTLDTDKCIDNAECVVDSEATQEYKCACKEGYTKGEDDNTLCKKVETPTTKLSLGATCEMGKDECIDNAECVLDDTQENKCVCKEGYTKGEDDNTLCKKVEPTTKLSLGQTCEMGKDECIVNAECVLDGDADQEEYICQCKEGFMEGEDNEDLCVAPSLTTTTEEYSPDGDEGGEFAIDTKPTNENEGGEFAIDTKPTNENVPEVDDKPRPHVAANPGRSYDEDEGDKAGTGFISYFLVFTVLVVAGYLIFHNKQKIIALVVEGKTGGRNGRRPNTKEYRQLKTNDVMPSLEKSAANKTYVF